MTALPRLGIWLATLLWVHRPTPSGLLHSVPDNPGDTSFLIWTMSALKRAALQHPTDLFDGNTFLPHGGTLLFSDLLAGMAVPYGVLTAIGLDPILAFNLLHLGLGLVALEAMYRLARRFDVRPGVAVAAAIAFAFSSFTLSHWGHVNLQAVAVLPLGVLLLVRVFERPTVGRGAALGAFVAAVYLTVGYLALMLVLVLGALAAVRVVGEGAVASVRRYAFAGATAVVVAAIVAGPAVLAFLDVRGDQGFERSEVEVRQGRLDPDDDLVEGPEGSWVFGALDRTADDDPEHGLALDAVMVVGAAGGLVALVLAVRRRRRPLAAGVAPGLVGFALVGVVGYWLALGPTPGLGGLAFRAAVKLVPGFDTVRVPARFALLLLFALCGLGAVGWELVLRRQGERVARVVPVVLVGLVLAQAGATLPRWHYDDRASSLAVYRALAERPAGAVVALPMRDVLTTSGTLIESTRMVYSTVDWNPRVNGYSSFVPSDYEPRRQVLETFPSAASLELLRSLDVRYVLLEVGKRSTLPMYQPSELRAVLDGLPASARATRHGEAYLVELAPDGA